jgi:iron complex outermembrane recepter protein
MNSLQPAALRLLVASLFGAVAWPVLAAEEQSGGAIELSTIAVTANPLGVSSDELVVPVATLSGRELTHRREATLGETLKFVPGVSTTSFGPNASRPIIRGLDAERVRILQNGIGVLDASSLSFDHAVAIDPLIIEQIDVVRGPAALLYGGSAVGGVVNAIDHRIPKQAIDGLTGRSEIRYGGPATERSGAIVLDAGNGLLTFHADAYARETNDLKIPGFAGSKRERRAHPEESQDKHKLRNTAAENHGGALGVSLALENGYAGISYSTYDNKYGVPGHGHEEDHGDGDDHGDEGVLIDQRSQRFDFDSELRDLGSVIERVRVRMAHTNYRHEELEGSEVATSLRNRGLEGSVEAKHADLGLLSGVIGLQFQNSRFEASGEEAFVPSSRTFSRGVYLYEELPLDRLKLSFGGRVDHVEVDAQASDRFSTARSNSFTPTSVAIGGVYKLTQNWSFATNLSHNERAPAYFELYANGPHLATQTFEIGNPDAKVERAHGIDGQIRWNTDKHSFSVGAYYTRFQNFIGLFSTGNQVDEEGVIAADGELIEAQYRQVPADFRGLEAQGRFRIFDRLGNLDLNLRADYVRATDRDSDDPLPRISPLKLGAGLDYRLQRMGARLDVLHAFNQSRNAENEFPTDGYTLVNATVSYRLPVQYNLELYARGYNLLDQEIREHTSFLKEIAPLGGRSLLVGLRSDF